MASMFLQQPGSREQGLGLARAWDPGHQIEHNTKCILSLTPRFQHDAYNRQMSGASEGPRSEDKYNPAMQVYTSSKAAT